MRPYEAVAVPESEHIEQNAEQLEAAFRWEQNRNRTGLAWCTPCTSFDSLPALYDSLCVTPGGQLQPGWPRLGLGASQTPNLHGPAAWTAA